MSRRLKQLLKSNTDTPVLSSELRGFLKRLGDQTEPLPPVPVDTLSSVETDILDAIPDGVYILDSCGRFVFINSAAQEIIGYTQAQVAETAFYEIDMFDSETDLLQALNLLYTVGRKQAADPIEVRMKHRSGSCSIMSLHSRHIQMNGCDLIMGTAQNITKRKKLEAEFHRTLENTTDGIWYWDFQTNQLTFSPKYYRQLGYEPDEFPATFEHWMDLIHPDDREQALAVAEEYQKTKPDTYRNEMRLRRKDGSYCHILANAAVVERDARGNAVMMVGSHHDITDVRTAEKHIRVEQARLESIFRAAPIAIGIVANRTLVNVNQRFCRMTGYTMREVIGQSARMLYPSESDFEYVGREKYRQIRKSGCGTVETRWQCKNGKIRDILLSSAPLNPTDLSEGVTFTALDITELKQAESDRMKINKLESLGVLAGGIAHDFNNILMSAVGNVELARRNPKNSAYLDKLDNALDRAAGLARQLLTFARGGDPVKESMNIRTALRETTDFALEGSNVLAEYHFDDNACAADADPQQISRVFHNLAVNAREAMKNGGTYTIHIKNADLDSGNPMDLPAGGYLRMTFSDTGPGIPPEDIENIFDPYFSTRKDKSGIGLSICYSVIRKHGGTISARSECGRGAEFTILLPASKDTPAPPVSTETNVTSTGRGRILVMDDAPDVRQVAVELIEAIGYTAVGCENGEQALELYTQAMKSNRPFDVVMLDLTVPGGKGGAWTMQELLRIDPDVRAIVCSGYAREKILSDYQNHGFQDVIKKPYKLNTLADKLNEVLK